MAGRQLYRSLLNELRANSRNGKLNRESVAYRCIRNQFEKHQTTDEIFCKAREEMKFLAETYLCYSSSLRKCAKIQQDYSGHGERSVKQTADIVGFKLPQDPK